MAEYVVRRRNRSAVGSQGIDQGTATRDRAHGAWIRLDDRRRAASAEQESCSQDRQVPVPPHACTVQLTGSRSRGTGPAVPGGSSPDVHAMGMGTSRPSQESVSIEAPDGVGGAKRALPVMSSGRPP